MKKTFFIVVAVLAMFLISATTVSVMTVKPAKPIQVFCKTYSQINNAAEDIKILTSKGWIVKSVSTSSTQHATETYTILVMEKY